MIKFSALKSLVGKIFKAQTERAAATERSPHILVTKIQISNVARAQTERASGSHRAVAAYFSYRNSNIKCSARSN